MNKEVFRPLSRREFRAISSEDSLLRIFSFSELRQLIEAPYSKSVAGGKPVLEDGFQRLHLCIDMG